MMTDANTADIDAYTLRNAERALLKAKVAIANVLWSGTYSPYPWRGGL